MSGKNAELNKLTIDPAYQAVDPSDFMSLLEVERYGNRSSAFDKIISATHDHFLEREKGINQSALVEAIEAALVTAAKKVYGSGTDIYAKLDQETGGIEIYQRKEVTLQVEDESMEISLLHARQLDPEVMPGDEGEIGIDANEFGRIAAQTAKQVIVQKVREAERARVVNAFQDKVGELVMGTVKRVERGNVYIDLGDNVEAIITRDEMIPREAVRPGDRLRGYLKEVRAESRGPQLFVSRSAPEFLVELFKLEVPEVGQDLIEIISGARDPGSRAKIAVKSSDPRLDPVGACVGMRGSRVQSVSNELAGERVDIILWDENPAQFVINAMSPAEVVSIVVDEDSGSMDIAVDDEKLSQAIGRGGQNIRMASQLTSWDLNVMTSSDMEEKSESESKVLVQAFMEQLDVDEEMAAILAAEGFSSVEEVAYVPESELMEIEEFDENIVQELRGRARDALLTRAISQEEGVDEPQQDLLDMEGMEKDLAYKLAKKGIISMEDLAEQSVDELIEIESMTDERASQLIMTARAPWFENETNQDANQ